jgi:hypothetical protein
VPPAALEEAADELAAYLLDGQLHLLWLADGRHAHRRREPRRFIDTGSVYADGARLRLLPFSQVPLR